MIPHVGYIKRTSIWHLDLHLQDVFRVFAHLQYIYRSFYAPLQQENDIFVVCLKTSWYGVYSFNANELHVLSLSPEEGVTCVSLCIHCISASINTAGRSNVTESERTGVQPYIWELGSQSTESGTKQRIVTELARGSMAQAALRTAQNNLTSTALIS